MIPRHFRVARVPGTPRWVMEEAILRGDRYSMDSTALPDCKGNDVLMVILKVLEGRSARVVSVVHGADTEIVYFERLDPASP